MGVQLPQVNIRGCAGRFRRIALTRNTIISALVVYALLFLALGPWSRWAIPLPFLDKPVYPARQTNEPPMAPLSERVPCYGPRGQFLSRSPDDELHPVTLNITYPIPLTGSYEALGLDQTWMTPDGRYGPYGYGEHNATTYNRSRVDWDRVDWGQLQNECFDRNAHRFPEAATRFDDMTKQSRLTIRNDTRLPYVRHWHEFKATRRTAIVVRAWHGYDYKAEDMHSLRSLIVETSLRTGGEYQVILLVDMKKHNQTIFRSAEGYEAALIDAGVPPELRSIAIMWDDSMLETWYPDIYEHRTMWQVYQPMQILALHYPEFDHFWQVELDMRFTGDAGKYLDRLSDFARNEPRKQALERSTFQHMQSKIGSYENFFNAVDAANNKSAYIWGPLKQPEIEPIGPEPPVPLAEDDDFKWGVGHDADVIVTSMCNNASAATYWVFHGWLGGFAAGEDTVRFFCPPAITRTSRTLLLAIHQGQLEQGLRVPSEATPPSFALYHGLKLSFPQMPVYWHKRDDDKVAEGWWKGGPANGNNGVGPVDMHHPPGEGLTFWWGSFWPRVIVDAWEGRELKEDREFPWILHKAEDGQVYIPNLMLHPMKHNKHAEE
ncbi:hypothetical protein B0T19DRAFT_288775 [Cercophora scortea]|uniref:Uncharacterized protein n=1 Tax=Cercophora scortea TaxID=314031 RepID=A0AAE0I298_9PEZI|nr:hypothetical protein B0T19DRAFT_288775 [Cercophora scortea]